MNRKKLLLCILLIVFAAAVVWSYLSRPKLETADTLRYPPGKAHVAEKRREPPSAKAAAGRTLRLDLLDRSREEFTGYHRDIFRPVFVDEVREMKKRAAAVKPVLPPAAPPRPKPVPPPPPVAAPEPPAKALTRFTFLGFLSRDAEKTIFLAKDNDQKGKEKEIILVKRGDTFGGRYQAVELTDQALKIVVSDSGDEIVVPLIENQALRTIVK